MSRQTETGQLIRWDPCIVPGNNAAADGGFYQGYNTGGVVAFKQDVWLKTAVGKDLITEAAQRGIAVHQYKGLVTDLV